MTLSTIWLIGAPLNGLDRDYRRTATNSAMRRSPVNATIAPIKSSAITGDACSNSIVCWTRGRYIWSNCTLKVFIASRHQTLPLVEALKPFSQFTFTETPLATEFESRQLFILRHTQQSALRYLQHVSGLPERQKTQRIGVVFHRGLIEQRQCHCVAECSRPFLRKSGRF